MKSNVEMFNEQGVERIITSCSGCFNMLRTEYPRYVDHSFEVIHISQLLETTLAEGRLKLKREVPMKVTYHDPCHLGRMSEPYEPYEGEKIEILSQVYMWDPPKPERRGAGGVYDAPRNVLKQIPGIELVEMERIREYSYCCGAGGGVKAAFAEFALWTATERVQEAEETGAKSIVSVCPFCSTNFQDSLKHRESDMEYYDLTELVLMSLEGGE
jgi:Fe-S oxidoreductase